MTKGDDVRSARERILSATAQLLAEGGREAVSTRAVGAAAGVQAPTIYRLFADMRGLLDAVAAEAFSAQLRRKIGLEPSADPVADLRAGWDMQIDFGLANPALYLLMCEPRQGPPPPAALAGAEILAGHIRRIAAAGRLQVSEERAARLIRAAASGTTITLISTPAADRDPELSVLAREAVIAAIITDNPVVGCSGPVSAAVAMRAVLPQTTALTEPEKALLEQWLDRIAAADHRE